MAFQTGGPYFAGDHTAGPQASLEARHGEIRWMDVSAHLKRESAGGKTVRQIVFGDERFDMMSVGRWSKVAGEGGDR